MISSVLDQSQVLFRNTKCRRCTIQYLSIHPSLLYCTLRRVLLTLFRNSIETRKEKENGDGGTPRRHTYG